MDGEEEPVSPGLVDEHLTGCQECRQWEAAATAMTRRIRLQPAAEPVDLTDQVLAAAKPIRPKRPPTTVIRWALGSMAFLQLSLALAQLLGVDHAGHAVTGSAEHYFNESAAWNLALAAGFLVAAVRPSLARGLIPAVAVFVVALGVESVADVLSHNVDAARLSSHAMVVIGLGLLFLVERQERRRPVPGRGNALPVQPSAIAPGDDSAAEPAGGSTSEQPPDHRLRPAGHRAA